MRTCLSVRPSMHAVCHLVCVCVTDRCILFLHFSPDTQLSEDLRNMTAETLNFGPEWLRALSSGGSVTSPPPSPAMPKYKLAEYRYGREEMLALYIKENKAPEDMQDKEFASILQDEPMQPLALEPLTEEEQVGHTHALTHTHTHTCLKMLVIQAAKHTNLFYLSERHILDHTQLTFC
uniref:Uncharacterized protein n=1 Tax=Hucho hucho TaxID=62062 RepID=A0A4W5KS09_9TELE